MKRAAAMIVSLVALGSAGTASARVLRVGTYKGIRGQYEQFRPRSTRLDRATGFGRAGRPQDDLLPKPAGRSDTPAAVLITKPRVYVRGMNRNKVIVDGTKSGPACSRSKEDQNFGPHG